MRARSAICILGTLLLSGASPVTEPSGPAAVTLKVAAVSTDELADVLGVYVWKFDASLPADAKHVTVALRSTGKGGSASQLGAGTSGPVVAELGHQVLIAIVPIGGSIHDADRVRVVLSAFGTSASAVSDNPLKSVSVGRPQRPESVGGGVYNLVGGYAGTTVASPVSAADVVVALHIETR